jgi:hypothetical protein
MTYVTDNNHVNRMNVGGANRWLEHRGHVRLRRCSFWERRYSAVFAGTL